MTLFSHPQQIEKKNKVSQQFCLNTTFCTIFNIVTIRNSLVECSEVYVKYIIKIITHWLNLICFFPLESHGGLFFYRFRNCGGKCVTNKYVELESYVMSHFQTWSSKVGEKISEKSQILCAQHQWTLQIKCFFLMWVNKWFWGNQFSSVSDKNTCVDKLMLHYTSRGFSIIWKKCEGEKRGRLPTDLTHHDVHEGRGRGPSQGGWQVGLTFFKIIY